MDFSRNSQPTAAPSAHTAPASGTTSRKSSNNDDGKWGRIGLVAAIAAVAVLLIGLVMLMSSSKTGSNEQKLVDTSKLQAVFLSTGQVYFGNVKELNSSYFVLDNIYYLQTSSTGTTANQQNANTSVSLVKLGCELHSPFDKMVINREQVTFWENLQPTGQVAQAVKKFKDDNPNGQKCSDTASNSSTTNNVQGSTNTNTNTNTTTNNTNN